MSDWKYPHETFKYEKRILIKQTNMLGNTYFANYVEWQGEARESFFLEHPNAMKFLSENQNIMMITYATYHRFLQHTFFGDVVEIQVNSKKLLKHSAVLTFKYFSKNKDNALIGSGWQKICFADAAKDQIVSVPQVFLDLLEPVRIDKT